MSSAAVIMRSSTGTKRMLKEIFAGQDVFEMAEKMVLNQDVLEAILVSSYNLYQNIVDYQKQQKKFTYSMAIAVMKYVIRYCSRPTPFGLMGGVSSTSNPQNSETIKKLRLSNQWLHHLIKKIELVQEEPSELNFYINPSITVYEQRISLESTGDSKIRRTIDLKRTELIEHILQATAVGKDYTTLVADINEAIFKQTDKTQAQTAVRKLIERDILISDLRPSSLKTYNNVTDLLNDARLTLPHYMREQLSEIEMLFNQYRALDIGDGIDTYITLTSKMKELCPTDRVVVVDLHFNRSHTSPLEQEDYQQLSDNLQKLYMFNRVLWHKKLWNKYCFDFLSKYGLYNEIKLKELVRFPHLGVPNIAEIDVAEYEQEEYEHWMLKRLSKELHEETLSLTDRDIEELAALIRPMPYGEDVHAGYDFKFSVFTEQEAKKILLRKSNFSPIPGSFTGRFTYAGPIHHEAGIVHLNEGWVNAEIDYHASSHCDIGVTNPNVQHKIVINTVPDNKSIHLDDLYVGMDQSGLYVWSETLKKKILPTTTSLLQYGLFSENKELLFLFGYSRYMMYVPADLEFNIFESFEYVPRIEYKNIVLYPKRLTIRAEELEDERDLTGWMERIAEKINRYKLTRYVTLDVLDQYLVIDHQSRIGLEVLAAELKKNGKIKLSECPDFTELADEAYMTDYILSMNATASTKQNYCAASLANRQDVQYVMDIDEQWSAIYVYVDVLNIQSVTNKLLHWMYERNVTPFLVNYTDDDGLHLRIRYKHEGVAEAFRSQFEQELMALYNDRRISQYKWVPFVPEYNRYGGTTHYEKFYNFFVADTKLTYYLQSLPNFKLLSDEKKGVFVVLFIILHVCGSYSDGKAMLERMTSVDKSVLKKFNSNRQEYKKNILDVISTVRMTYEHLAEFTKGLQQIMELAEQLPEKRYEYAIDSLIHMSLNRTVRPSSKMEVEMITLARYVYHNLQYEYKILGV